MYNIEITADSKLLALYLGWEYIGFSTSLPKNTKGGWYKNVFSPSEGQWHLVHPKSRYSPITDGRYGEWVCRTNSELRFYNSYDWLFEVVNKVEKEDLSEYFDDGNFEAVLVDRMSSGWDVNISLRYDPPIFLYESDYKFTDKENLFYSCLAAVKYINERK